MRTYHARNVAAGCWLLLTTLLAHSASAQPFGLIEDRPGGPVYLAGDVLVQFKRQATDAELADAVNRGQLGLVRHIQTEAMRASGQQGVSHMWTRQPVRQAIQALQNHPAVEFAEPNWVYEHQATANDPLFLNGGLWGMYGDLSSPANPYGSQAAEAWAAGHTGSAAVVIGVIDEGVQIGHPDLAPNIWVNPYEIAGNGVDDDANGYVDDVYGWDFQGNDNSVYDGTGDDHGTHVAGTIGAAGNNALGVVGVNWTTAMIVGKFLGPNGGSTADAIEAVDYFTALKTRAVNPINVVALNNSWGGGGYSQALHAAIIRAAKAEILFVAAAGNGNRAGKGINNDTTPFYPASYNTTVAAGGESAASYDSVIAVTAINSSGAKASFGNYGATSVDLGAPGVSVNSTVPTSSYGSYSGTSMATPHVTGAIALYASTHPGESAAAIKNALLGATAPTASLAGITVTGGRLDLSTVITPADPVDPPPTVSVTSPASGEAVSGSVTVAADASDDLGVTQVEFFVNGNSIGTDLDGADGWTAGWDTSTGADGAYVITAVATDTAGQTGTSAAINVTVDNVDDAPAVSIASPANGSTVSGVVAVSANASDDGGISQVEFFVNGTSIGTGVTSGDSWTGTWDTTLWADGSYELWAVATDSGEQMTTSAVITVQVNNSVPTTLHSGDLDGTKSNHGANWIATVTITIHDASEALVNGATVTGTWSNGFSGAASGSTVGGKVSFSTGVIPKKTGSVTFTITGITHSSLTYDSAGNHDPDGDSNGTIIVITKP
jgi:subtilisin family serine protease